MDGVVSPCCIVSAGHTGPSAHPTHLARRHRKLLLQTHARSYSLVSPSPPSSHALTLPIAHDRRSEKHAVADGSYRTAGEGNELAIFFPALPMCDLSLRASRPADAPKCSSTPNETSMLASSSLKGFFQLQHCPVTSHDTCSRQQE